MVETEIIDLQITFFPFGFIIHLHFKNVKSNLNVIECYSVGAQ